MVPQKIFMQAYRCCTLVHFKVKAHLKFSKVTRCLFYYLHHCMQFIKQHDIEVTIKNENLEKPYKI